MQIRYIIYTIYILFFTAFTKAIFKKYFDEHYVCAFAACVSYSIYNDDFKDIYDVRFQQPIKTNYSDELRNTYSQGWEFAHLISERIARFLSKNERMSEMSDSLTSLISSERPEPIAHGRSFLVSDLSDLLTSLTKKME